MPGDPGFPSARFGRLDFGAQTALALSEGRAQRRALRANLLESLPPGDPVGRSALSERTRQPHGRGATGQRPITIRGAVNVPLWVVPEVSQGVSKACGLVRRAGVMRQTQM